MTGHRLCAIAALILGLLLSNGCATQSPGPKVIEADGVRYIACGGAIWVPNQGNLKDPITMTYDVAFEDDRGAVHRLTGVHSLIVTDLPANSPLCKGSASGAKSAAN
jgi:hypothetical protein